MTILTIKSYDSLHKKMEASRFRRKITVNKIVYWLPNAEYGLIEELEIVEVRDLAVSIPKPFGLSSAFWLQNLKTEVVL